MFENSIFSSSVDVFTIRWTMPLMLICWLAMDNLFLLRVKKQYRVYSFISQPCTANCRLPNQYYATGTLLFSPSFVVWMISDLALQIHLMLLWREFHPVPLPTFTTIQLKVDLKLTGLQLRLHLNITFKCIFYLSFTRAATDISVCRSRKPLIEIEHHKTSFVR